MPLTHSSPLPRASKRRTKESAMNKYAVLARTQWQRYAPTRLAALPEPDEFFARLGELVEAHVSDLAATILSRTPSSVETYLQRAAALATARRTAEEVVMAHLVWVGGPELPLDQAHKK